MAAIEPESRACRMKWMLAGLLIGGLFCAAWFLFFSPEPGKTPANLVAALQANNSGIGLMESFRYDDAAKSFEEAVRLAPASNSYRINLGIALLNSDAAGNRDRATLIFREILTKEPDNPYARHCLGIIAEHAGRRAEAYEHFTAVTRIDSTDAFGWYRRARMHPQSSSSAEAKEFFRKALELDPYLNGARYSLAHHSHEFDADKSDKLLAEHEALKNAFWDHWSRLVYTEMGRYAEVIGRHPDGKSKPPLGVLPAFEKADLQIKLAPGARWAKSADFGDDPAGKVRQGVRERFGATAVLLDYNGDGRIDVFLLGAVVENGKVRDLLLRADDPTHFTDSTAEAGLAQPSASVGCCVGDFDNDGLPDLFISGVDGQRLVRNTGKGFEDVSKQAGLEKLTGVCLASTWVDLDQDGDLDLLVAEVAPEAKLIAKFDLSPRAEFNSRVHVFLNVGVSQPTPEGGKPLPLTVAFRPANPKEAFDLRGGFKYTGLAVSDLDGDGDVDVLALADHAAETMVVNDRLLRFRTAKFGEVTRSWNGALVLDLNRDERSDLLLLPLGAKPESRTSKSGAIRGEARTGFDDHTLQCPPLKQAHVADIDLDGWPDVVALSNDRIPVVLQNSSGVLTHRQEALAANEDWPLDLLAVAVADLDGDCNPDVLVWSEAEGLQLRRSKGNGNRGLKLHATGNREEADYRRTNADGVGAWVSAQAGTLWTGQENTTLAAGLGQSRLPLHLGIGKAQKADFVRILWPDCVPQGELDIAPCNVLRIEETYRKGISCPILYTWNGSRFVYVTDFLGAGSVGEQSADGSVRPPRPEESIKLESNQLGLQDGVYVLKIGEPMDEVTYLDRLQLLAVDHPPSCVIFPDERFATGDPAPTQELLVFRDRYVPVKARDQRGRNVTELLCERDGRFVSRFARRSWIGYAEEHWIELEFGAKPRAASEREYLVLAGWTDYPYPESIFAATQAGIALLPPVLERLDADGKWQTVCELGFPAGLPRVMTRDVTGLLGERDEKLRIRTNMQVHWDQICLARLADQKPVVQALEVSRADLEYRGFTKERSVGKDGLIEYDPDSTERVAVTPWRGKLTRLGDVTELLTATDDRMVLIGPGDEATVHFDARHLTLPPQGWTRSFVLKSWGWCKDAGPFTATTGEVGPLPYRAMKNYPPGPNDKPPANRTEYERVWNTREASNGRSR